MQEGMIFNKYESFYIMNLFWAKKLKHFNFIESLARRKKQKKITILTSLLTFHCIYNFYIFYFLLIYTFYVITII